MRKNLCSEGTQARFGGVRIRFAVCFILTGFLLLKGHGLPVTHLSLLQLLGHSLFLLGGKGLPAEREVGKGDVLCGSNR